MIWFSVSKHLFNQVAESQDVVHPAVFDSLDERASTKPLLPRSDPAPRPTPPKPFHQMGFNDLGKNNTQETFPNLVIFSTNILLDFIFLTVSHSLRVASPATVQQKLWWPRWLLGTCFAHASVSHVNTGFRKKFLRLDFKSTTEYNSHQIFACNSFLYDCESTPRKV